MKSMISLILLAPLVLTAATRTIQYQGREGPVQLPVAADRITVMVDSSRFTDWESILESNASIDPSHEVEPLWGGFYIINLRDGADPLSVIPQLSSREDIAFAYPVFSNSRGEDIYMTNHVVVHFNDDVSLEQNERVRPTP